MTISLRKRLIGTLLLFTLAAWLASAVLSGFYAARVLLAQVDRQLEQYVDLVNYVTQVFDRQMEAGIPLTEAWLQREGGADRSSPLIINAQLTEEAAPALNIFLDGRLWAVLEDSPRFATPSQEGFSFLRLEEPESRWRLLARYDERTELWILVGLELDEARWALFANLAKTLFPLLIILPLTIALLYYGVTRGLRPLRKLTSQIQDRSPRALDPVVPGEVPEEIVPVVDSLNDLLQRLSHALEAEQRFTANAAHELLTPLAAVKAEVQLCQRRMVDSENARMLDRIAARVDRASHTVDQLLTMARVDPDAPLPTAPVPLQRLVADTLAETAHLARERELEIDLDEGEETSIDGNREALAILLRNLLVNAFRYATPGSRVSIGVGKDKGGVALAVGNACAPLSEQEFAQLEDRFYRVPGSSGLGAGLGLSIVRRIADQHGAQFSVGPAADGSGFLARVVFPA